MSDSSNATWGGRDGSKVGKPSSTFYKALVEYFGGPESLQKTYIELRYSPLENAPPLEMGVLYEDPVIHEAKYAMKLSDPSIQREPIFYTYTREHESLGTTPDGLFKSVDVPVAITQEQYQELSEHQLFSLIHQQVCDKINCGHNNYITVEVKLKGEVHSHPFAGYLMQMMDQSNVGASLQLLYQCTAKEGYVPEFECKDNLPKIHKPSRGMWFSRKEDHVAYCKEYEHQWNAYRDSCKGRRSTGHFLKTHETLRQELKECKYLTLDHAGTSTSLIQGRHIQLRYGIPSPPTPDNSINYKYRDTHGVFPSVNNTFYTEYLESLLDVEREAWLLSTRNETNEYGDYNRNHSYLHMPYMPHWTGFDEVQKGGCMATENSQERSMRFIERVYPDYTQKQMFDNDIDNINLF